MAASEFVWCNDFTEWEARPAVTSGDDPAVYLKDADDLGTPDCWIVGL